MRQSHNNHKMVQYYIIIKYCIYYINETNNSINNINIILD